MRQTECYKRLPEKVQNTIRVMSKEFARSCKISDENLIMSNKFQIIKYLEALSDMDAINSDEEGELYEVIVEDGDKSYEGN